MMEVSARVCQSLIEMGKQLTLLLTTLLPGRSRFSNLNTGKRWRRWALANFLIPTTWTSKTRNHWPMYTIGIGWTKDAGKKKEKRKEETIKEIPVIPSNTDKFLLVHHCDCLTGTIDAWYGNRHQTGPQGPAKTGSLGSTCGGCCSTLSGALGTGYTRPALSGSGRASTLRSLGSWMRSLPQTAECTNWRAERIAFHWNRLTQHFYVFLLGNSKHQG